MRRLSTAFQSAEPISVPTNKTIFLEQTRKKTPLKARRLVTDQLDRWHDPVGGKQSDKLVLARLGKESLSQIPSTKRGSPSPVRARPTPVPSALNATSAVSIQGKQLRGKQKEDAHQLRLNYNKLLQWQFVNARGAKALSTQKEITEVRTLY
jgi:QWRF family